MQEGETLRALRELTARLVGMVAPFVAEYLPIGTAIDVLKLGAVDHLIKRHNMRVSAIASHLNMSERWAYKYRMLLKAGAYKHLEGLPARLEVLDFFVHCHPKSASMTELSHHLETRSQLIQPEELVELLDAYCSLGYLEFGEGRFKWRGAPLFMDSAAVVGRAKHASGLMGLVGKSLRTYVETNEGALKHVHVTVTRAAYRQAKAELDEFLNGMVTRAVERSIAEDPEGLHLDSVNLDAVIFVGTEAFKPSDKE